MLKVSTTEINTEGVTHTMSKHNVICLQCGRKFDADEGGYYLPESRRYVCKYCANKQKAKQAEEARARKAAAREAEADEREEKTGMRQTRAAMLAKIVVGVLFLVCSVPFISQGNIPAFLCGLAVAAALVAWGLVPYLKAKKGKRG